MERKTLDFDRFLSEKRVEYVTVTVLGRPYRVKKEIPAMLPILLAREAEEGNPTRMGQALLRAGDTLFGAENMDGFCRQGLSAGDIAALVEQTLALICGQTPAANAEMIDDDGGKADDAAKK